MSTINFKEILTATLNLYKDCLVLSYTQLLRSWPIIIGSLLAYTFLIFAQQYLSFLGILGGFAMGLLYIAILTLFYGWIFKVANKTKVTFDQLFDFDFNLFQGLISVGFILWIANDFLINPILAGIQNPYLRPAINLGLGILLNPVAETITYHRYESIHAIKYSINFISTNWIEWFIPFVIVSLPLVIYTNPLIILQLLSSIQPLMPSLTIFSTISSFLSFFSSSLSSIASPIALIITLFFAIFRAKLFIELESGSRRQRIFKAKQ